MKQKIQYIAAILLVSLPSIAFAQKKTLKDLIAVAAEYLDQILLLLMGVAVVMFVWYIIKYFIRENDNHTEAAKYVMWSLIGFFAILSLWGMVNVVVLTFDLRSGSPGTWTDLKQLFPR